jgi:hypothetical protein
MQAILSRAQTSNQAMQPTAGRSDASLHFMKAYHLVWIGYGLAALLLAVAAGITPGKRW